MKSAVLTPRSEISCFIAILLATVLFCCAAPFLLLRYCWPAAKWLYKRFFLIFLYPTTGLY